MSEGPDSDHPLLQVPFPWLLLLLLLLQLPHPPHTSDMAGIKVTVVLVVGVWASCLGLPQYPAPPQHYAPAPSYKEPARPYNYAYSVQDDYKGLRFGADESSDGNTVKGSYNVDLPDGRNQKVDYTADHYAGFNAEVTYTGEAQHPHQSAPAPYHPPPPPPYHG